MSIEYKINFIQCIIWLKYTHNNIKTYWQIEKIWYAYLTKLILYYIIIVKLNAVKRSSKYGADVQRGNGWWKFSIIHIEVVLEHCRWSVLWVVCGGNLPLQRSAAQSAHECRRFYVWIQVVSRTILFALSISYAENSGLFCYCDSK